jgi:hypothetical protein
MFKKVKRQEVWKELSDLPDNLIRVGMIIKAKEVSLIEGASIIFHYTEDMMKIFGNKIGKITNIETFDERALVICPSFDIQNNYMWSKGMFLYSDIIELQYRGISEID